MKTYTSFKTFAKSLTEEQIDLNKFNIAKHALLVSDKSAKNHTAMSKADAVEVLKSAGMHEVEIKALLIAGGALPSEIEKLMNS